ncbi:MAG: DUF2827 family protein [Comamonadaceae bacterium]|nr:MAG: DUF2827 family protein [Comamonadaceae bacterium]
MRGYPLIHNAHLVPDLGYYYAGNEVQAGAARVREAIDRHPAHSADYLHTQRSLIGRFLPDSLPLVAQYAAMLDEVVRRPAR